LIIAYLKYRQLNVKKLILWILNIQHFSYHWYKNTNQLINRVKTTYEKLPNKNFTSSKTNFLELLSFENYKIKLSVEDKNI